MTHLTYTVLFAILISVALAVTGQRSPRLRAWHAAWVFSGCICSVVAGAWIMFLIH